MNTFIQRTEIGGSPDASITLIFYREELINDIESYCYIEGDVLPSDFHGRHQVFDIAQAGNEELATRILNLAHAECNAALYPFTKKECGTMIEAGNRLELPDRYEIELTLPATFSQTSVRLLKELIHNYLVTRVIKEWLGMLHPESVPYWETRLDDIKNRIRTAVIPRRNRIRIRQSLF